LAQDNHERAGNIAVFGHWLSRISPNICYAPNTDGLVL
jgi:hypothetical protein